MGSYKNLKEEQSLFLEQLKESEYLSSLFYFTGGTLLSSLYLHHRESEDLDFFAEKKYDKQAVYTIVEEISKKLKFKVSSQFIEVVYRFQLESPKGQLLKVDFSYYPFNAIEKREKIDDIYVDSKIDIAVNKLLVISQRSEVKDFVDLYFLLKSYSIWDLVTGLKQKFNGDPDPLLIASDMTKVQDFTSLPIMLKPLSLTELKKFFFNEAKKLGLTSVGS
ncbi:MAG: nucleotidyl transferase AbiEii/AbiGii toxin family protein [bacterium]|nr:nucleotidyl transferase AbiEii/AbiGii toxin family protein [bacterium]